MELLQVARESSAAMTSARSAATAAALTATLGLAAASWVVAVRQMTAMDMGVATRLGSFAFFVAVWVSMMAAMMLPGAAPAVLRRAQAGGVRAVPLFVESYLAVWALVGVGVLCGVPAARCRRGTCPRIQESSGPLPCTMR
jgi:predicted metal-binding membrane protein